MVAVIRGNETLVAYGQFVDALIHVDAHEFAHVRETLIALGKSVIPALVEAIPTTTSDRDRWRILLTLAEIGGPDVVPVMIAHLRSPSSAIRALAAQFLGQAGDSRAVEPMMDILRETDPCCASSWVIGALGKLGDTRAIDPLIRYLHITDSSPERYSAIEALGLLGDARAIDAIRTYEDDPDHHVRDRVQIALERLGFEVSYNNL